jgi:pimeloyl-ACP methyl ester carboxylesterase
MPGRDVVDESVSALDLSAASFERTTDEGIRGRLLAGLPVTDRRLELASVSTAVLEGGDGPPIVLLPAPGEFAALWMRVIPDLVTTHRVIAPDLPGSGASVSDGPPNFRSVLTWLGELIAQTCVVPPVLVGHTAGAALAARFAVKHGDRLDRLVLVDSYGLAPFRPAAKMVLSMIPVFLRPTERSVDRAFRHCFVDMDAVRAEMGERWDWMVAYALDRFRTPSVKAAGRSLGPRLVSAIPSEDLARIAVPSGDDTMWGLGWRSPRPRASATAGRCT